MRPQWLERLALVFIFLLAPATQPIFAQQPQDVRGSAVVAVEQPKRPSAEVVLDGKNVIEIRWGVGSITPQVRAEAVGGRLLRLAQDTSQSIDLTTHAEELRIDVLHGDAVLASVFAGDAAAAGVSQQELADSWKSSFTRSMNEYRAEHGRGRLLQRIGLTALIILLTVGILWVLVPITRWLTGVISREVLGRLERARGQSWSLIDGEQLNGLLRLILRTVRLLVSLFIIYIAFQLLFWIYPQTRPLGERMLNGVIGPASQFGKAAWDSAPSLVFIAIIALACKYLVQLVSFAFSRIGKGHVHLEGFKPHWAPVTSRLVNLALVLLAVLIAYPYIPGSQSAAFKGFSLFLGVLVSLGSTGVVANVLNGILLTYMDSFQKGDFVQIGSAQGYVEATSLFVTRLRTRQQTVITIPNSQVLSGQIVNYSVATENSITLSATAGIGYDTPWRQVEAMLLEAARSTRTVKTTPAPYVLEISLNSFDITYELTVFLTGEIPVNVIKAELNRHILDAFNRYGVQIMTPAYVADPPKPAVVEQEKWYAAPAARDEDMPPK